MDTRKWLPSLPLFGSSKCVYCGGAADTSDHTPPRCFLPRKLPTNIQLMTIPACSPCNRSFQMDELRAAAIICAVSFTDYDRAAVAEGGWLHAAMQRDRRLRDFIDNRLQRDGMFGVDNTAADVFSRVLIKTAVGLLFYEFGQVIAREELKIIGLEHTHNVQPDAFVELHRRVEPGWAEVTPSCRELERQVMALCGIRPRNMPRWKIHVAGFFEYMLIRRTNAKLLCAIKIHDAITVVVESRWPFRAGPLRKGKPRPRS